MTKDELKEKIDTRLGLESTMTKAGVLDDAELCYISPANIILFRIGIFDSGNDKWQFGSISSALPDLWSTLTNIHRES